MLYASGSRWICGRFVLINFMRNGCLLIGEKTAVFVRYIIYLFYFNNKFLKINHDNNVMISQKINEVQIIIKPSKKKQGGL